MSDLVKRIQQWGRRYDEECVTDAGCLLSDAVDEIERLERENALNAEAMKMLGRRIERLESMLDRLAEWEISAPEDDPTVNPMVFTIEQMCAYAASHREEK